MPINNKLIIHHSNILLERPWKTINFPRKKFMLKQPQNR